MEYGICLYLHAGFTYVHGSETWDDAKLSCEFQEKQLACLNSQTLYQAAKSFIESTSNR
jgi:hypothetical protein